MNNPLMNVTVTVPAGLEGVRAGVSGKYVKVVSCTQPSVLMGFDGGNAERVYPDDCYAGPAGGFRHLRFVADTGACTVVIQVSEQPVLGGSAVSLAPVQALLSAINGWVGPATTRTQFPRTTVGLAGAATQIFAANTSRHRVQVQADADNTGKVWLGSANTVTQTLSWFELLPGATSPVMEDTVAIWACSENGTEKVRAYEDQ